ncbi:MAG: RdgB/HAM1 family non-canonical purine NTP pyrophosphatase [Oscillibacter sp.]|nr:RdgB/HAM1 family non-canonical purine NTP pyrophosphatase [Oscillibacter sp.]
MALQLILATHNPGKLTEMQTILTSLGVQVLSPADAGVSVEVEETGSTFAENALLKAKAICAAAGLPAIGDDSGLCVDALNGGPGVYSARYGGEGLDDRGRQMLLLDSLRGQGTRAAHFTCAVACAFPNGDILEAEGRCDGAIAYAPLGDSGFGYDPVFLVPSLGKTFGQLSPEEKSAISHRGKALAAFAEKLGTYLRK